MNQVVHNFVKVDVVYSAREKPLPSLSQLGDLDLILQNNLKCYGDMQQEQGSSFRDAQLEGPSSFGDLLEQGPSLYDNALGPSFYNNAQGLSSFDNTQEQPGLFYGDSQGASSYDNRPLLFGNTQEQLQPGSFYDDSQDTSLYKKIPYYKNFWDNSPSLGPSGHRQGLMPVSQWVEGAPDHGISIGNSCEQGSASAGAQQPNPVAEQPSDSEDKMSRSPLPQATIHLMAKVIKQMIKSAKKSVTGVVFSKYAMLCPQKRKRQLLNNVIKESVPNLFGPNVKFEDFITTTHRRMISNTLSAKHGKLIDFICEGVCHTFQLFPP
ncbi:hypothetical protein BDR05DRAFT_946810 [Suillus weaverae]|nr:hypothetical protein BDR05DRAFT_946810 [Suillus weaverae]